VAHDTEVNELDPSTFSGADQYVWAATVLGVAAATIMTVVATTRVAIPTLRTLLRGMARNMFEERRRTTDVTMPPAVPSIDHAADRSIGLFD
jgi:hypothetical protein